MKLTTEQAALQKALARVVAVVPRKNTIPILANLMIDAQTDDDGVWLVGTDLNLEARVRIDAEVERPGRTTVPAILFDQIVRNAPSGALVELDLDAARDARMLTRFGRSRYNVPVLPPEDFPVWKMPVWKAQVPADAVTLSSMIERCLFAVCTDETRHYLQGAYLHASAAGGAPRLRFTATNGHVLAWGDGDLADKYTGWPGVIVPTKTLSEFRAALAARAGQVMLRVAAEGVQLQANDLVITSKVISGDYVDYERLVPRQWDREARVNRRALADAVTRVNVMTTDKASSIKLSFAPETITLTVRNDLSGQVVEEIAADFSGGACDIGFNARYLLTALKQTEAEDIVLAFQDDASPMRVEPVQDDPEHGAAFAIVMPQRG